MPNLSYKKIEAMFEEKFQEAIKPLSNQDADAMQSITLINEKYDEITKLLKAIEEE